MWPVIFSGFIPFYGLTILGTRSIMSNILAADCLPSAIFFRAGDSWLKLKHPTSTAKKTVITLPAV